jgi:hypothetical protein
VSYNALVALAYFVSSSLRVCGTLTSSVTTVRLNPATSYDTTPGEFAAGDVLAGPEEPGDPVDAAEPPEPVEPAELPDPLDAGALEGALAGAAVTGDTCAVAETCATALR